MHVGGATPVVRHGPTKLGKGFPARAGVVWAGLTRPKIVIDADAAIRHTGLLEAEQHGSAAGRSAWAYLLALRWPVCSSAWGGNWSHFLGRINNLLAATADRSS